MYSVIYIDDILVTDADNELHLQNLSIVSERLQRHGIRLKKSKCHFMANSAEYLGHQINAEGLHTTSAKVEAVRAPPPKNQKRITIISRTP